MKSAAYMIAGCTLSWAVVTLLLVPDAAVETLAGMMAPLVVAVTTMALFERAYARAPGSLTPLMIKAFGVKLVLFGAYVALLLGLTPLAPVPFAVSFCVYFVSLHMTEALMLRSLFTPVVH